MEKEDMKTEIARIKAMSKDELLEYATINSNEREEQNKMLNETLIFVLDSIIDIDERLVAIETGDTE